MVVFELLNSLFLVVNVLTLAHPHPPRAHCPDVHSRFFEVQRGIRDPLSHKWQNVGKIDGCDDRASQ